MAYSKTDEFDEKSAKLARFAKAMSHPARIEILKILLKQNACYCGNIVEEFPISQATVSQHLKELKDSGLIQGEINPPKVMYCINPPVWEEAKELFKDFWK